MRELVLGVCLLFWVNCVFSAWSPNEDLIVLWENEIRPGFNYREGNVADYELPDILRNAQGAVVTTVDEWLDNRSYLLQQFREHVYGVRAGPPSAMEFRLLEQDPAAMGGKATLERVQIVSTFPNGDFAFELIIFRPNEVSGAVPVFLLMNNRGIENTDPERGVKSGFWPAEAVIERGYGIAAIQNNQLAPDDEQSYRQGVIRYAENAGEIRSEDSWGAIAAWGWGASRAMDYFERNDGVDHRRVALVGHSRGGKAALWTGAEDERFSLIISNNSGSGGAALSRRKFGETVAEINNVFPYWFAQNFHQYGGQGIDALPVDQHQLIGLIAPRAVYVASASEDLWADPRGEYLALAHASKVYELFGAEKLDTDSMPDAGESRWTDFQGYHLRIGDHNLTPYDWNRYMDFADQIFR